MCSRCAKRSQKKSILKNKVEVTVLTFNFIVRIMTHHFALTTANAQIFYGKNNGENFAAFQKN
jgi:hypothetical protein